MDRLAAEALHLVSIPSVTGDERAVMEAAAALCDAHGLETELHRHDLALLRAHPDHPGEEAPRDDLWGVKATLPGTAPGRIAIDGHLDVVPGGPPPRLDGDRLYGRGSVDMTGPWVAALHAIAGLEGEHPEIVLLGVPSEEDGGLGTFAALEDDDDYDAAILPEPTGFDVVVAQAGALTFNGIVTGTATHAAMRLEGESALDRYIDEIAPALRAHEAEINSDVEHPAMAALPLPYPVSVGRLQTGEWSSSVPDHLVFEGRLGVRVGEEPAAARTALEERLGMKLTWTGGAFHSGAIDPEDPWAVAGGRRGRGGDRHATGSRRRPVGRRHAPLHRSWHPGGHDRPVRHRARPLRSRVGVAARARTARADAAAGCALSADVVGARA